MTAGFRYPHTGGPTVKEVLESDDPELLDKLMPRIRAALGHFDPPIISLSKVDQAIVDTALSSKLTLGWAKASAILAGVAVIISTLALVLK